MPKNYIIYKLLIILSIVLFSGCKKKSQEDGISHGYIVYKISYTENNLKEISPSMLPKRMYLEFNEDFTISTIEGFMGFFRISNYTSLRNKKSTTQLKVIDKNYMFESRRNEKICCFDEMNFDEIVVTDEQKTIAGLECKKAVAFLEGKEKSFDFYFTDEILLDDPNAVNPYSVINGVLMEFNLNLNGVNMKFTAQSFENREITEKDYTIPDEKEMVSREQMTQILHRLLR